MYTLQLSGGEQQFVESSIVTLKRRCVHQLSMNTDEDEDEDDDHVIECIQRQMCIDRCQPHGHCQHGRCICSDNYTGSDCSLSVAMVPADVTLFARGLCRVRSSDCHVITVVGTGFVRSDRLTCRLEQVAVSK